MLNNHRKNFLRHNGRDKESHVSSVSRQSQVGYTSFRFSRKPARFVSNSTSLVKMYTFKFNPSASTVRSNLSGLSNRTFSSSQLRSTEKSSAKVVHRTSHWSQNSGRSSQTLMMENDWEFSSDSDDSSFCGFEDSPRRRNISSVYVFRFGEKVKQVKFNSASVDSSPCSLTTNNSCSTQLNSIEPEELDLYDDKETSQNVCFRQRNSQQSDNDYGHHRGRTFNRSASFRRSRHEKLRKNPFPIHLKTKLCKKRNRLKGSFQSNSGVTKEQYRKAIAFPAAKSLEPQGGSGRERLRESSRAIAVEARREHSFLRFSSRNEPSFIDCNVKCEVRLDRNSYLESIIGENSTNKPIHVYSPSKESTEFFVNMSHEITPSRVNNRRRSSSTSNCSWTDVNSGSPPVCCSPDFPCSTDTASEDSFSKNLSDSIDNSKMTSVRSPKDKKGENDLENSSVVTDASLRQEHSSLYPANDTMYKGFSDETPLNISMASFNKDGHLKMIKLEPDDDYSLEADFGGEFDDENFCVKEEPIDFDSSVSFFPMFSDNDSQGDCNFHGFCDDCQPEARKIRLEYASKNSAISSEKSYSQLNSCSTSTCINYPKSVQATDRPSITPIQRTDKLSLTPGQRIDGLSPSGQTTDKLSSIPVQISDGLSPTGQATDMLSSIPVQATDGLSPTSQTTDMLSLNPGQTTDMLSAIPVQTTDGLSPTCQTTDMLSLTPDQTTDMLSYIPVQASDNLSPTGQTTDMLSLTPYQTTYRLSPTGQITDMLSSIPVQTTDKLTATHETSTNISEDSYSLTTSGFQPDDIIYPRESETMISYANSHDHRVSHNAIFTDIPVSIPTSHSVLTAQIDRSQNASIAISETTRERLSSSAAKFENLFTANVNDKLTAAQFITTPPNSQEETGRLTTKLYSVTLRACDINSQKPLNRQPFKILNRSSQLCDTDVIKKNIPPFTAKEVEDSANDVPIDFNINTLDWLKERGTANIIRRDNRKYGGKWCKKKEIIICRVEEPGDFQKSQSKVTINHIAPGKELIGYVLDLEKGSYMPVLGTKRKHVSPLASTEIHPEFVSSNSQTSTTPICSYLAAQTSKASITNLAASNQIAIDSLSVPQDVAVDIPSSGFVSDNTNLSSTQLNIPTPGYLTGSPSFPLIQNNPVDIPSTGLVLKNDVKEPGNRPKSQFKVTINHIPPDKDLIGYVLDLEKGSCTPVLGPKIKCVSPLASTEIHPEFVSSNSQTSTTPICSYLAAQTSKASIINSAPSNQSAIESLSVPQDVAADIPSSGFANLYSTQLNIPTSGYLTASPPFPLSQNNPVDIPSTGPLLKNDLKEPGNCPCTPVLGPKRKHVSPLASTEIHPKFVSSNSQTSTTPIYSYLADQTSKASITNSAAPNQSAIESLSVPQDVTADIPSSGFVSDNTNLSSTRLNVPTPAYLTASPSFPLIQNNSVAIPSTGSILENERPSFTEVRPILTHWGDSDSNESLPDQTNAVSLISSGSLAEKYIKVNQICSIPKPCDRITKPSLPLRHNEISTRYSCIVENEDQSTPIPILKLRSIATPICIPIQSCTRNCLLSESNSQASTHSDACNSPVIYTQANDKKSASTLSSINPISFSGISSKLPISSNPSSVHLPANSFRFLCLSNYSGQTIRLNEMPLPTNSYSGLRKDERSDHYHSKQSELNGQTEEIRNKVLFKKDSQQMELQLPQINKEGKSIKDKLSYSKVGRKRKLTAEYIELVTKKRRN